MQAMYNMLGSFTRRVKHKGTEMRFWICAWNPCFLRNFQGYKLDCIEALFLCLQDKSICRKVDDRAISKAMKGGKFQVTLSIMGWFKGV